MWDISSPTNNQNQGQNENQTIGNPKYSPSTQWLGGGGLSMGFKMAADKDGGRFSPIPPSKTLPTKYYLIFIDDYSTLFVWLCFLQIIILCLIIITRSYTKLIRIVNPVNLLHTVKQYLIRSDYKSGCFTTQ